MSKYSMDSLHYILLFKLLKINFYSCICTFQTYKINCYFLCSNVVKYYTSIIQVYIEIFDI